MHNADLAEWLYRPWWYWPLTEIATPHAVDRSDDRNPNAHIDLDGHGDIGEQQQRAAYGHHHDQ